MRCIFIDDEIHAVETMTRLLIGKVNIQLTTLLNNPHEILEEAKSSRDIDVAMIDIFMEGVDGIHLSKELIKLRPNVKIILITGFGKDYIYKKAKNELGSNLYKIINKPYTGKAMLETLDNIYREITADSKEISIVTIGGFEVYVKGEIVKFSCRKGKELLAVLVHAMGTMVSREQSIGYLWQDSDYRSRGKSYDHAKQELSKTLREYGIEDILQYQRGSICIIPSKVQVDSWDLKKQGKKLDSETYLKCYEWEEKLL